MARATNHRSAPRKVALEDFLRRFLASPQPRAIAPAMLTELRGMAPESLGPAYERVLVARSPAGRKAAGAYYTPEHIVRHVVRRTLDTAAATAPPRVLDPSCGAGAFLLAAYRALVRKLGAADFASRRRVLTGSIFGVDIDADAVAVTRLSLLLCLLEGERGPAASLASLPDLSANIVRGNSIVGPDCPRARRHNALDWAAFGSACPAFDAVIGNPPWGQKAVAADDELARYLRNRYVSVGGIGDLFRPFVERGIELLRDGGRFGMVLPDIVLLKNYAPTRRYILDHLALTHVDWWGMAFPGATIDAATIIGRKSAPPPRHGIAVAVHGRNTLLRHRIPQAEFLAAPRHVFNLHLTPRDRRTLKALAALPALGDYFEIHEGVHSGNMRGQLFVDAMLDRSCEPLLFGRDEIAPFVLRWNGKFIRLSALQAKPAAASSPAPYANLGRPHWHHQPKLLVRRTGDRVIAAVDPLGRYASNNFFLVLPKRPCGLTLDGLAAWLNSEFMTWFFRTIEPRTGRAFAELKIKHLRVFPLPAGVHDAACCRDLNELGRQAGGSADAAARIQGLVRSLVGL